MNDQNNQNSNINLFKKVGVVTGVADGIVSILGISEVAYGETVDILTGDCSITCLVLNLENNKVSAIILDDDSKVKPVNLLYVVMF